jgi:ABC-type uncharacterized transport system substrate-binding protein
VLEHDGAVMVIDVIIQPQPRSGTRQHGGERGLAALQRLAAQIVTVQLQHIERIEEHRGIVVPIANTVATASPSMMQERARRCGRASTISVASPAEQVCTWCKQTEERSEAGQVLTRCGLLPSAAVIIPACDEHRGLVSSASCSALGEHRMRRREFIAILAGAAAWPFAGSAQQADRVRRIGMLETVSPSLNTNNLSAFRNGLRELGYIEGQSYQIEYRSADGRAARFEELASELVVLKVDVIVTRGTPAALAAKKATETIPIVMAAIGEPIATGVVAGLARPGGNVTGLSAFVTELAGKRVELFKEAVPGARRVGFLNNMSNPVIPPQWEETKKAALGLRIQAELLDVRTKEDVSRAFEVASKTRIEGLLVGIDAVTQEHRKLIAQLAKQQRLPTICASSEYVSAEGLLSYGVSYPDLYRRAAGFVDKIFKGAKPGELPVEQPTKFELVINLKTAVAIGMTFPPTLLARADEVIE